VWPSAVAPGATSSASAAAAAARAAYASRTSSPGPTRMVPAAASTATSWPASRSSAPATRTTHGMPSCPAMIAVWLVGPPSSVTIASVNSRFSAAVSAGARSLATITEGSRSSGTPGGSTPSSVATTRSRTLCRSVTRSARYPPAAVNIAAKFATTAFRAWSGGSPLSILVSTCLRRARSSAIWAVAERTSATVPDERPACSRRPAATPAKADSTSAFAAAGSAGTGSSEGTTGAGRTLATGPQTAPRPTPTPASTVPCSVMTPPTGRRGRSRAEPRARRARGRPRGLRPRGPPRHHRRRPWP